MGGAKEGAEKVREEKYRKMRGKAVGGRDGRLRDRAQNRIRRLSGGGGRPDSASSSSLRLNRNGAVRGRHN